MKKGTFSGLLYRELALTKKPLIITLVSSLSAVVFSVLVVLSFRYGNLALLDEKVKEAIFGEFAFAVKALPALSVCFTIGASSDTAIFDVDTAWERFRRSTPISCFKFALAKYTITAAFTLLVAGSAIGITALMCAVMGTTLAVNDIGIVVIMLTVAVVFCVIMQVSVTFFKSADKGGLVAVGVVMACLFIMIAANNLTSVEQYKLLMENGANVIPYAPFIILATLALGLFATTMIYKRREK